MFVRLLLLINIAAYTDAVEDVRCFECLDIPHPAVCNTVTSCSVGQLCAVEQISNSGGRVRYNIGCNSRQLCSGSGRRDIPAYSSFSKRYSNVTCAECCDGNHCNNQGCGTTAPAQPQRGVMCYACNYETSPESCHIIQTCDYGEESQKYACDAQHFGLNPGHGISSTNVTSCESQGSRKVCMLTRLPDTYPDGSVLYRTSCASPMVCQAYSLVGRKRTNLCHMCCSDDFCNDRCDVITTRAPTTPSTITTPTTTTPTPPPSTTTTITTSTTITTTPKPTTTTTTATTTTKTPPSTTTTTTTTTPTATATPTNYSHSLQAKCAQYHYTYHATLHFCFKFYNQHKPHHEANAACAHDGATLAVIDSQAKWNILHRHIPQSMRHQQIYIGGTAHHGSLVFMWPSGQHISYANWAPGEPNGGVYQRCMYLNYSEDFQWHDIDCNEYYVFICTMQ